MTLTMPRTAMLLLGDVAYPMRSLLDGNPLAAFTPELPEGFRWANDEEVLPEHVTLDQLTVSALLFCSTLNTGSEPGVGELLAALNATLTAYGCHVERCVNRHDAEVGDYPEDTARRWSWCVVCAARLLSVEV